MSPAWTPLPHWRMFAGALASALLLAIYVRGAAALALGFVALVPFLLAIDSVRTLRGALGAGALLAIAMVGGTLFWFGAAVDAYTGIGRAGTLALLCAAAPLLQPQAIAFALARHLAGRVHGAAWRALAGACAWVACEWLWPKLLGDTLGHGLQPSPLLRQAADLGGAAGLTFMLLLGNEAFAAAVARRRRGWRAVAAPIVLALAIPGLLAAYGAWRLSNLTLYWEAPGPALRVAMVQASIVDYERRRADAGTHAVVREVLDAHFALSRAAIEQHGAEALLWPETVYPTPFGQPRSAEGAAFDREIQDFVDTAGVPLLFGTYEVDTLGEYNAAALLAPETGLVARYRKTHPFPLTESVPAWLEGPTLRRVLPWAGTWRPGDGARVFPLRAADGRALQVVPLICLDAVRPQVAIDGARLGAQAIVGLSNDAWFTGAPLGARLHLAVAAFRSIETRLPQLRATNNGLTAFIDPTGEVLAATAMGDRAVLAGAVPIRAPPPTLMVRWGDWVGGAALAVLCLLLLAAQATAAARRPLVPGPPPSQATVSLLTPPVRALTGALRVLAAGGLVLLLLRMVLRDGLQVNSLLQLQLFAGVVVAPMLAAAAIRHATRASARTEAGALVLERPGLRIEVPLDRIAGLHAWRLPLPGPGLHLELVSGRRLAQGIALADLRQLARLIEAGGATATWADGASARRADAAADRAAAQRTRLDHPLSRFLFFPLLPGLVAFRLHQHIAFGGTFGEWQTYGPGAWSSALAIWWAAWSLGLMLFAGALRLVIEPLAAIAARLAPTRATGSRLALEALGRFAFYVGAPFMLAWRLL
ncbi:MAG: apolipoprotein N-acyltransferase [Pseudomonadota bacterium]